MSRRASAAVVGICYGAAGLLAVLAFASFLGSVGVSAGALLLLGALVLAISAAQIHGLTGRHHEEERRLRQDAEQLHIQLEEHKSAVDALADSLDVGIFICDPKANVLYANRKATDIFRFDNPQGRNIIAVTLSHDLGQLVAEAIRAREAQSRELIFTYPEERIAIAKAWTASDTSSRVFLSVFDITDLRRLERVRQDFVANVSHELRTPLSIIRAMAETLLDEQTQQDDLGTRYLNKIIGEVDRLSMITQDLLVLSAAESNPVRKQVCDIADVYRTAVNQLSAKVKDKALQLGYEGPDRLLIEANTSQMTQVAINLIDNAINYTPEGSVQVSVKHDGSNVEVRVEDTGIGISSDHVNRIFERFYRVDKARSRATGGTGLGLSIVKHIVEAHGGSVDVESNLNQGSTFVLHLPVGQVDSVAA